MVAGGRLVGLARAGAASQAGSDGGRTDEQEEIPPLDRHPDTLPRVRRVSHPTWPRPSDDGRRADPAFVGTGVLVMAAARPWRRVAEGRDQYLVGFGELKGVCLLGLDEGTVCGAGTYGGTVQGPGGGSRMAAVISTLSVTAAALSAVIQPPIELPIAVTSCSPSSSIRPL